VKLLSTSQAVFIGLASMLGAGVFVVFGPAAKFAGSLLPLAVVLAGLVAYLNAMSISQLAKVVTRSGGAYSYARYYISDSMGFVAGAAFLFGKLGSVAAIALTFASYLVPEQKVATAVSAILVMTWVNILGINRTALGAKLLASITLSFLTILIIAAIFTQSPAPATTLEPQPLGLFTAAALIFFAFAGYARVATLGGEVQAPAKTIPKAIAISLWIVGVLYLALSFILPLRLGSALSESTTPLADLSSLSIPIFGSSFVSIFAAVAALGSLLALLAGMGRTASVMAEDRELPSVLAMRNKKGVPWLSESLISALAILLVLGGNLELVIGLSSFAVLVYYAIANLAAYRQPKNETYRRKFFNLAGLVLCLILAIAVPLTALLLGLSLISLGLLIRWGLAKLAQSR
jgi:APA family basic amino acid/polyamine antiporter